MPDHLEEALYPLRMWMAERNISTDNLTLIFNFAEARDAVGFEIENRKDTAMQPAWVGHQKHEDDHTSLKVAGLSIIIESPVHAQPDQRPGTWFHRRKM